ncbi:MAG: hypothetical protein ACRDL5_10960, partial [Solirubrobacteraceae bacterium]
MSPRRARGRWVLAGSLLVVLVVLAVAALILSGSKATLSADATAIAKVNLPFGAGSIRSVSVVTGPHSQPVPVTLRDDPTIMPTTTVPANERLEIQVVVKRPGWISWLAGSTQRLDLTVTTPVASLRSHYVTLSHGGALELHFRAPISAYAYGSSARTMTSHMLS